jgi:Protein of unknown function (DUF3551)
MRLLLFILGIGVGLVGTGNRADAQNYPWCSIYTDGLGGENCGFTTFQQCLANVSGLAASASEIRNTNLHFLGRIH